MCHGSYDYRLEEIPVPAVKGGEVLVHILAAGICAGDVKCFTGAPLFWGDEYRQGYCQPPVTPGHEFVGEVVALPADTVRGVLRKIWLKAEKKDNVAGLKTDSVCHGRSFLRL
jgi:D-arabinose 1-dehydrogenase-like Zn-dependent alcohol dehydrogenase